MKSINNNAPVTCSKSISVNANAKRVWAILTTIDNWAAWQTDISQPKLKGALQAGSRFDWKTGGVQIRSVLHTVNPEKEFGWTGKTFGIFAIHNWTLTENNGQTIVTVTESMEGFLARIFKKAFQKNLEKGMVKWLNLLKEQCETTIGG